MKWNNKGHQFDYLASVICNKDCEYIIWGAGTFGKAFYDDFKNRIKIVAFVDSDESKQKILINGIPVLKPNEIKKMDKHIILVSTGWTNVVFNILENKGYIRNESYFHIDEFMTIYMMYKENKLFVSNLNINITEFCSLKCKNCSALNPYIPDKKHYSLQQIDKMLEIYFKWVDGVSVLGLVGGDAMVHPQFKVILEIVGNKYLKSKAQHIEVYSNAVVIPDEETLELFKKYNVIYRFTDYGVCAQDKQKICDVVSLLDKWGIKYDHAKFDKWSDCGYPQETNGIPIDNLCNFYNSCDRRSCQGLMGTRLFYCGMAIGAERAGYCKSKVTDYYELNQKIINKIELMEFMLGYNERGFIEYCKKCNGGPNINTHYIIPGEQLN